MRSLEDLIQDVGGFGPAQYLIIILTNVPRMAVGWTMYEMSFANFVPQWCCPPDNLTTTSADMYCRQNDSCFDKKCSLNTTSCSYRVFASGVQTIVNEWSLVCERKWMLPLTTSVQMVGVLAGAFLAGQMGDRWGRKKIIFFNSACCSLANITTGFSTTWEMFTTCRFVIGLTLGGFLAVCVPYTTEFIIPSKRAVVSILPAFNFGVCFMALTAWRIPDWRILHWIIGAITLPLILGYFFLPESLRWLSVHGRVEEAEQVVKWIAHKNKHQVPKDYLDIIKNVEASVKNTGQLTKYTYLDLYRGWRMFKTSISLQFLWCIFSMAAYGLAFGASAIGGNVYLNIFLLNVVAMTCYGCLGFVMDRFGRKRTAICGLLLASASGFTSLAVRSILPEGDRQNVVITALSLISRAALCACWAAVSTTTNEIYPTVFRALGYGAANVTSRIGGILAPFALNFQDNPTVAFSLIGGAMLLGACIVPFLEEMSGKAMRDTVLVSVPGDDQRLDIKKSANGDKVVGQDPSINDISSPYAYSNSAMEQDREDKQNGVWQKPATKEDITKDNGYIIFSSNGIKNLTKPDRETLAVNIRL